MRSGQTCDVNTVISSYYLRMMFNMAFIHSGCNWEGILDVKTIIMTICTHPLVITNP